MGAFELIDHPPIVSDLAATTTQNQPLSITTAKLLAHASDPDGYPLAVSAVSPASTNGGVVVITNDVVCYTPVSGFVGQDRFSYTVSDGDSQCGTATANVVVNVMPASTQVVWWGTNNYGQGNIPWDLTDAVAISAGFYHSLALKADRTVVGWGNDASGEADPPIGLSNVTAIAAGQAYSLSLKQDGTVQFWGEDNSDGSLNATAPLLTGIKAISAGYGHGMGLTSDGTVVAWGLNTSGQTNVPVNLKPVTAISAGGFHSLVLQNDGTVVSWGRSSSGQTNVPPDLTNVVAISAGGFHNLALKGDGTVVAWGRDDSGQSDVPAGLSNVVAVSGGAYHSLALKSDGTVVAWGQGLFGQTNVPANLTNVIAISAGGFHNLALVGSGLHWMKLVNLQRGQDGSVQFSISGVPGDTYGVLASTNLVDWQTVGIVVNFTGTAQFTDPAATNCSRRYYRCVMP